MYSGRCRFVRFHARKRLVNRARLGVQLKANSILRLMSQARLQTFSSLCLSSLTAPRAPQGSRRTFLPDRFGTVHTVVALQKRNTCPRTKTTSYPPFPQLPLAPQVCLQWLGKKQGLSTLKNNRRRSTETNV